MQGVPEQNKKDMATLLKKYRQELQAWQEQQGAFEQRLQKFRERQRDLEYQIESLRLEQQHCRSLRQAIELTKNNRSE